MAQAAERAIGLCNSSAAASRDAHLNEAHADEGHHNARDKRGDDTSRVLQQAADDHLHA